MTITYPALRDTLQIKDGTVRIDSSLSDSVQRMLVDCYGNQPIVITGAAPGPHDGEDRLVVITGKSSFMNVLDLPVTAAFSVDEQGEVHALLTYTLLGTMPGPNDWRFSRSFPQLPTTYSYLPAFVGQPHSPLDALNLFDAAFTVTTHPGYDTAHQVDLAPGINFLAKLRPTGLLGIFENLDGAGQPLTIFGTVVIPKPTDITLPLKLFQYPWDLDAPPPGISLTARLDLDLDLDSLKLDRTVFRMYSPLSTTWLEQNPTFDTVTAYSARLSIPSADIAVTITAITEPGSREALFRGDFTGVSVGKLADLLDISGPSDLAANMPEQIVEPVRALNKLELMNAGLYVTLDQSGLTLNSTFFTIGMPELNWQVWEDRFAIDSLACTFSVRSPFRSPSLSVMLSGSCQIEGVPVRVMAGSFDGFTVYAELGEAQTIPLRRLLSTYAPDVEPPGDLTVDTLRVTVAPFKYYTMAMEMAGEPNPWVIEVGPQSLTVRDLTLSLAHRKGAGLAGSFGGSIAFGDVASLSLRYDIPGDVVIRGDFPLIRLSELLATLVDERVDLPSGFDLTFENSSVLIQKAGPTYAFRLGTALADVGSFAFEVRRTTTSGWGVAAGLSLVSPRISTLPGLSALSQFEDLFQLQKLLLVVASFEDPAFTFPDLAAFQNPAIRATNNLALPSSSGVIKGFNLYAQWRINTADPQQKLLRDLLGLNPLLDVALSVGLDPAKDARLAVSYSTVLQGHPLRCTFGGQIRDGQLGLFFTGSFTVSIQNSPQFFDVVLLFVEKGAFISGSMRGPKALDFEVFQLANLALQIGVNWDGIPSLGIAATIAVERFQSSVAVFFDSTEPKRSLVAGSLSDLHLGDVLETLAGTTLPSEVDEVLDQVALLGTQRFEVPASLTEDLNALRLETVASAFAQNGVTIPALAQQVLVVPQAEAGLWFLTDLTNRARHYSLRRKGDIIEVSVEAQFYCAPATTFIGALRFDQGFYLNGAIQVLDFDAVATVDISPNIGIALFAQMDRLVIGSEELFRLEAAQGGGGPIISAATFSQPNKADPEFRAPHFYINGKLTLLGASQAVYVRLTKGGFAFDLTGELLDAVEANLHGSIGGKSDLNVGGSLDVGIGTVDLGELGEVEIETGVAGALEITVDELVMRAVLTGSFEFAGETHELAPLELDVHAAALVDVADLLYEKVKDELLKFFDDAERWLKLVGEGVVEGVDDAVEVLENVYGKTREEAEELVAKLEQAGAEVGQFCAVTRATLEL